MKRLRWFLALPCVLVGVVAVAADQGQPQDDPGPDSGFVRLFDGKDLSAWRMGPDRSWVVEDGVIALRREMDGSPNKFPRALKAFARSGHVGLQDHGRPVWYRNIRVKRLDK